MLARSHPRLGKCSSLMRVLVAEDDAALRSVLDRGLRENGYVVDVVADGDAAVNHLRTYDYEVAILDWRMPKKSGLEALDEARGLASCDRQVSLLAMLRITLVTEAMARKPRRVREKRRPDDPPILILTSLAREVPNMGTLSRRTLRSLPGWSWAQGLSTAPSLGWKSEASSSHWSPTTVGVRTVSRPLGPPTCPKPVVQISVWPMKVPVS